MNFLHPDLHMHSTVSDGSDTPIELIKKVKEAGIDIFALTDHDTYHGCKMIRDNLKEGDPFFIGGIELSCRDSLGTYHILGYCYDVSKQSIIDAANVTNTARREKAINRFKYLEDVCHFNFTEEEKNTLLANENPGKPHFVALLLKKGYVLSKEEGFALMEGYKGPERKLTPEEGINAILEADGIPVLAHGIFEDGTGHLTNEEMDKRVGRLKSMGLMGLECYYSRYTPVQASFMLTLAEKYHLLVTAGSDYHGKNKTVKLGETGAVDPKKMERFYRTVSMLLKE